MSSTRITSELDRPMPSSSILGLGTLSMRDKSVFKRNVNRHHSNNMSAGYVPVHEEYLQKTGLRGRKTYLFWTVIAVLCVLVLLNLVFLIVILSVLRIGLGMESLEITKEPPSLKFYGRSDLGQIYKRDGVIEGFRSEPFIVTGDKSQLAIDIFSPEQDNHVRVMNLDEDETLFQKVKSFLVVDPKTGNNIFSTATPSFGHPNGLRSLYVDHATISRVSSGVEENLVIRSDSYIRFKGNEGTKIEGKSMLWSADQYLFLKSVNGSIIINGTKGIAIDMTQMAEAAGGSSGLPFVSQFKVCACLPSGKLFRVAVHAGQSSHTACNRANMVQYIDPCKIM